MLPCDLSHIFLEFQCGARDRLILFQKGKMGCRCKLANRREPSINHLRICGLAKHGQTEGHIRLGRLHLEEFQILVPSDQYHHLPSSFSLFPSCHHHVVEEKARIRTRRLCPCCMSIYVLYSILGSSARLAPLLGQATKTSPLPKHGA